MMFNAGRVVGLALAVVMCGVVTVAQGAEKKSVFDQMALIDEVKEGGETAYFGPLCDFHDYKEKTSSKEIDHEIPLKEGKKFRIKKRRVLREYVDVKASLFNPFQDPDMFVINSQKLPTNVDYCKEGGYLKDHVFAFGIHPMKDPMSPNKKSMHAFIYVPMNIKDKADPGFGTHFYLIVLRVVENESECDDDGAYKDRCKALWYLADRQKNKAPDYEFIQAVMDRIEVILPNSPPQDDNYYLLFHNGVIHGSL